MRVLVTGATGFLGSHLLPLLRDHDVLPLSRRSGDDLTSSGPWIDRVAAFRPQWCVHLAWQGLPDYSLAACRANLDASVRLLDVVSRSGVEKFVVAGSCWEYGRVTGAVDEDRAPVDPGVFAATKHAFHAIVESVARTAGFQSRWARIFFVYGPGQRVTSLIPSARNAYAAGRIPDVREPATVQDFVHVDDVAAALLALAASDAASGAFNVGTGEPTSVGAVVNRVASGYGQPRPCDTSGPPAGFWADTTKIQRETGWRARVTIDDGVRQTLAAMDAANAHAGAGAI